jgi:hypothetical protein
MPILIADDVLCCPHCGGDYLHHARITVFEREVEDSPRVLETTTDGRITECSIARAEESANPSNRRDRVAIRFWCEGCAAITELTLAQHKGQTLLDWRFAETGRDAAAIPATTDFRE